MILNQRSFLFFNDFFFPPNKEFGKPHVFVFAPQNFFIEWGRLTACIAGHAIQRPPKTNLRGSQSGGYLLSHNAVQYHRRCCVSLSAPSLCPVPALCPVPSPLSAPLSPASARSALSPAPARRRRAQPTPHTVRHRRHRARLRSRLDYARTPIIPPDYIKSMVSLSIRCSLRSRSLSIYRAFLIRCASHGCIYVLRTIE